MADLLAPALIVLLVAGAAVRSTWSPCGHSMLSSITPFAEQGRGHRFAYTASWYVVGATVGGLTLGLVSALLAVAVAALDLSTAAAVGMGAVLALVTASLDLGTFGVRPPFHRRQVNEDWLDQYRPWVYGAGFGWQIGNGVFTFIMTAAVFLVVAVGALTADPLLALAICGLFGLLRGLMVFIGRNIHEPADLRDFFRRFMAAEEPVRRTVIVIQLVLAVAAASAAWGIGGAAGALAASALLVGGAVLVQRRNPSVESCEIVDAEIVGALIDEHELTAVG